MSNAKIIAVTNQKGGVGKTTTAINLGASLATAELRVLVVDLDPQGNSTSGLGLDKDSVEPSAYEVLMEGQDPSSAVYPTEMETLDLLPANRALIAATVQLLDVSEREFQLRKALEQLRPRYDFILVDCPPSLGILTVNALTASDSVLIPIQCEYFALEGLSDLMATVQRIRETLNSTLRIEGLLLTMYDDRLNLSSQIRQNVSAHFGSRLLQTHIPRNVRLAESPSFGKPIVLYDARSKGANSYLKLAQEILGKNTVDTLRWSGPETMGLVIS